MIPAPTRYLRATSVEHAVAALAEAGEEAKLLSGGQSLIPLLRLRMAAPELLVDVHALPELRGVRDLGDRLWIGAGTRYADLLTDPAVRRGCPSLATVARTVADPAVRHRGTVGGAVAHADPAGDLPALLLALDAEVVVHGVDGERRLPVEDVFVDYLQSSLAPTELVTAVVVPTYGQGWGHDYRKFHRTALSWAVAGVVAVARWDGEVIEDVRVGLVNLGSTPLRARPVEDFLRGGPADPERVAEAAVLVGHTIHPVGDLNGSPAYRRDLARVLTRRALTAALGLPDHAVGPGTQPPG